MKIIALIGRGVIAPYVIDAYIRVFEEEGHKVLPVECSQEFPVDRIEEVVRFQADFVLSYGHVGFLRLQGEGFFFRVLDIPLVSLHYDNPFLELTKEMEDELRDFPNHYINFIWDQTYLDFYRSGQFQNGHHIMLAVDEKNFFPVKNNSVKSAACFVGAIGKAMPALNEGAGYEERFIHEAVEKKLAHFDASLLEICSDLFSKEEYHLIEKRFLRAPYHFWSILYTKMNALGSPSLRKHILDKIQNIELHIYGSSDRNNPKAIFHEKVPYGEELAAVYREYAININISSLQLETALNNRPFDVFAAGGFVLNDYRKDLEIVFPDHWEKITYRNIEDLQQKCEYYLAHEKERKELSDELGNIVRSSHTYRHRAKHILGVVEQRGKGTKS